MISVIIPVYNAEKYIKKCVESVMKQTYYDIEIILVNDGSTDGSENICKEMLQKDKRIRIFHQENLGVSVARNRGIEESQGEYLIFADSDDYLKENMIEVLYRNIQMQNADYVICDYITVRENQFIESEKIVPYKNYNGAEIKEVIANMIGGGKLFSSVWRGLYKTDVIKDNCIQFKEMKFAEDMIFNLEYLFNCNRVSVIKDKLYYYVENSTSALNRTKTNIREMQKIPIELHKLLGQYDKVKEYNKEYCQEIILMIERIFYIDFNIKKFISNIKILRNDGTYSEIPKKSKFVLKCFIEKKWISLYLCLWIRKLKNKINNLQ